ncbi:amidohydrolase family protein [Pseudonocardia benzenivorans]
MPADAARSWAARVNDALLTDNAATGGPGVLATVALDDVEAAAKDLEAAVRDGCAGLVLSTDPVHCTSLADRRLDPLWTVAAGLGVPVQLHPPRPARRGRCPTVPSSATRTAASSTPRSASPGCCWPGYSTASPGCG